MTEWEPPAGRWDAVAWDGFFASGGAVCSFCEKIVDDRRYAVGLRINRAWSPYGEETRYAHVECLREAMQGVKFN